jgi:hypothetical protein
VGCVAHIGDGLKNVGRKSEEKRQLGGRREDDIKTITTKID